MIEGSRQTHKHTQSNLNDIEMDTSRGYTKLDQRKKSLDSAAAAAAAVAPNQNDHWREADNINQDQI